MKLTAQTRRQFCTHGCRAVSLAALGGALATALESCGGSSPTSASGGNALPTVNGVAGGGGITVAIDASSPLAAVGSAALVQSPAGQVLVAHTAQNTFTALSSRCTHAACAITDYASNAFVCTCHGSRFDTSGRVLNGPATVPLAQYQTDFTNGVLTIVA